MQRYRNVSVGPVAAVLAVALGVTGSSESQVEGGSAAAAQPWRTPWGHPDLQGTWSSDDVRGMFIWFSPGEFDVDNVRAE